MVNPRATKAGPGLRAALARSLAPHGLAWVMVTRAPGEAGRLAAEAAAAGARVVVSVGGDGTAADVAGALAGGPVVVVPFPAGNANVFARALGWPASATAALGRIGPALALGRSRTLLLGRLRAGPLDRVFCVNAGVGIDAETVRSVEAHPRRKRALRHAAYAMAAGAAAVRLARRPTPIVVRADDDPGVTVVSLVAACGAPYAWAGPRALDVLPGADFGGGIEWMGLVSAGPVGLAVAARGVLTRGAPAHVLLPRGRVSRALEAVAEGPVAVQADGEALGRHERIVISPGPALVALVP